jgi:hypothetical protein
VRDERRVRRWDEVDPELGVFKVELGRRGKVVLVKPT